MVQDMSGMNILVFAWGGKINPKQNQRGKDRNVQHDEENLQQDFFRSLPAVMMTAPPSAPVLRYNQLRRYRSSRIAALGIHRIEVLLHSPNLLDT